MKLIEFPEQTVIIAKNQPQYIPLPAYISSDKNELTCCWELSLLERIKLLFTGKIWHSILIFNKPLQPQLLQITKPF